MTNNKKRNAKSNETPSIVLKTIFADHMRDNPNSTLTTKKMRARLRVEMNDVHVRNSSWIFTQSQYDNVRAMFDPKYAERIERRAKRNAKSNASKRNAKSNVDATSNVDTTNEIVNVD